MSNTIINKRRFLVTIAIFCCALVIFCIPSESLAWNKSYIIADGNFIEKNTMSENAIQNFLESRSSYLAGYRETRDLNVGPNNNVSTKGWRASKIIRYSAVWYGINPQVILSTLQKEQSLITNSSINQYGINWAMGYGVPDGSSRNYAMIGFSKQVDMAAWQFRFNYEGSKGNINWWPGYTYSDSKWVVGKTNRVCYTYGSSSCSNTYVGNGATASLYRYTPYFHGNMNFDYLYRKWFGSYNYGLTLSVPPPAIMSPGDVADVRVKLKNVGEATWYSDSELDANQTRLSIVAGSPFYNNDGSWIGAYRVKMATPSVTPGNKGNFSFSVKAPQAPGDYLIKMIPVVEGITSMRDIGMEFHVMVPGRVPLYRFWSNTRKSHFYTNSFQELKRMNKYYSHIWQYEGVAYYVHNYPLTGERPVYRFYNQSKKTYFYTISPSERDKVIRKYNNVWRYQGRAFYVNNPQTPGKKNVYRFWSSSKQTHFYTASSGERDRIIQKYPGIWKYEGIAWSST